MKPKFALKEIFFFGLKSLFAKNILAITIFAIKNIESISFGGFLNPYNHN